MIATRMIAPWLTSSRTPGAADELEARFMPGAAVREHAHGLLLALVGAVIVLRVLLRLHGRADLGHGPDSTRTASPQQRDTRRVRFPPGGKRVWRFDAEAGDDGAY